MKYSRMDQDGSLNISFNEWRDFLLYAPSTNIHELILYWRHSTVSDKKENKLINVEKACKTINISAEKFVQ